MLILAFGLKTAPYIFNLFAEALHWIIQRHIPAALRHYLDDFPFIFPPGSKICNLAVECPYKSFGNRVVQENGWTLAFSDGFFTVQGFVGHTQKPKQKQ